MRYSLVGFKTWGLLSILAALIAGGLVQAQEKLPAPADLLINSFYENEPDRLSIAWGPVPWASGYQVMISGPGRWKKSRYGGWYTTKPEFYNLHIINNLMPGNTYNLRVRAIDGQGNYGFKTEKHSYQMPPCWVFRRAWETGYTTPRSDWDNPPPEWEGIKNTLTCK